jgi:hypothetical protein
MSDATTKKANPKNKNKKNLIHPATKNKITKKNK